MEGIYGAVIVSFIAGWYCSSKFRKFFRKLGR